jgi:ankyrin repeat protein
MDLSLSMRYVSVHAAVQFMHLVPKDMVTILMRLGDWKINIKNAKDAKLIRQIEGQKYEARTTAGQPLLWVCVDDEPAEDDKDKSEWMLERCLIDLLEDGCDPNIEDVNGETLLIHTINTNKKKSFEYLLKHGADL